MPKTDNGGASSWRKQDAAYREQERKRRRVNAQRRSEVNEAAARGIPVEKVRAERAEAS